MAPSVHPEAYVAPTAVLSGDVRVGPGSCIMHGAVLAAEGGPVQSGASCVIMENAVLRGTPHNPLIMGDHVLAGPHSHLTGCGIADEVFIATGARVFNGAQLGRASSVALGGTVHIGAVLPPLARVPIGWVALGEPAAMYPPGDAEAIRAGLDAAGGGFLPFVFGIEEAADRREQMQAALQRYTAAIARQHHHDEIIDGSAPSDPEQIGSGVADGSLPDGVARTGLQIHRPDLGEDRWPPSPLGSLRKVKVPRSASPADGRVLSQMPGIQVFQVDRYSRSGVCPRC